MTLRLPLPLTLTLTLTLPLARPGTAEQLKEAFAPTLAPEPRAERAPYGAEDIQLLDGIAAQLVKLKII